MTNTPNHRKQSSMVIIPRGFTLIELLVVIAIIAIGAAILFPYFAQSGEHARQSSCLANIKSVALAILLYEKDYDERYPAASFSDVYGDDHPVSNIFESGGSHQALLPDLIHIYLNDDRCFTCPASHFAAVRSDAKYITSGSYAYMCGHAHNSEPSSVTNSSTPLLIFLKLYGKEHGTMNGGDGSDARYPEDFFICSHRQAEVSRPSITPMIFCDGFVHFPGIEWESKVLPRKLGGTGQQSMCSTPLAYADGHVKSLRGTFDTMLNIWGITTNPRFSDEKH